MCGQCASGHSEKNGVFIRVGTVVGKMTITKQHTAPEGVENKKYKPENKSPLLPRYILRMYQEI